MIAKNFAKNIENLFERAAKAWERGNNGEDYFGRPVADKSANLARMEAECDRLRKLAERRLAKLGISVDYPGLYPRYQFAGRDYHELGSALQALCAVQNPS